MKFEEKQYKEFVDMPSTFVYFLLQGEEVVYVGQTTQGYSRILQHKDKIFDKVRYIECTKDDLDTLESEYILKYSPLYNKTVNTKHYISAQTAVHMINKEFFSNSSRFINRRWLFKILDAEKFITYDSLGTKYISIYDVYSIISYIYDYKKGAPVNEIYNIGV